MGMTGEVTVTRLRELALRQRVPFVWLLDSAGARIQEAVGSLFAGYEVIRRIIDDGELLHVKGAWARTIITCLARMGGRPVGIVANQPKHLGGILDNDSAAKAARFVNLCDAFQIPLVFLQDVPGFMVGTKVEAAGIIRHGAKLLHAVAAATVPKITVVLRKAYGAGYYVMCGRGYEPT